MLGQGAEIVDGAAKIAEGRSSEFVFVLAMFAMVAGIIYLFSKYLTTQSERHAIREKEDRDRQEKQEQFWRDKASQSADQLDSFAKSLDRTSRAAELTASLVERTDSVLSTICNAQVRDRRAIGYALDSIDARSREQNEMAVEALRDARRELSSDAPPASRVGS